MASNPTYEQAQLHLQVYEMRREARLRQARDWFFKNYFADTIDDAMRIAPPGTDAGTSVMMVFSYWEQACALLNSVCCTRICSLRRMGNSTEYGTESSQPFSRAGNVSSTNNSLRM